MKYILITGFVTLVSHTAFADPDRPRYPDYLGPVQYPAGASASAIAVNEAVRVAIRGKDGPIFCQKIDTSDPHGRCLVLLNLDAGSGAASGAADGGAGASGSR